MARPFNAAPAAPIDFPIRSAARQFSLAMPDEILDFYAWMFSQAGFANLRMTFEQFLTVVATFRPSGLHREYRA